MKQTLLDILRGAVIGIANIIPGVSGGTMMVSMGIYDTLIHCVTHLFRQFRKKCGLSWSWKYCSCARSASRSF